MSSQIDLISFEETQALAKSLGVPVEAVEKAHEMMKAEGHEHAHRVLIEGQSLLTSYDKGDPHIHQVEYEGNTYPTSSDPAESDHDHDVVVGHKEYTTGEPVEEVKKAVGLPETIDPNHEYVYKSGEYGLYSYWYKDMMGNYWKYTNAPKEHKDYDKYGGEALMDPQQPMPHTAPEYFTPSGSKRHMAVPDGMETAENPSYDPTDAKNIWFEMFTNKDGENRYVYLDSDIKENLDLWVQHQLRVVDVGILNLRQYANSLFNGKHPKDRITGAILILLDQGLFTAEELVEAQVGDVEFVDQTVSLLGRKFVPDIPFYDFITSLTLEREDEDPLFEYDTVHGRQPPGLRYIYSVCASVFVSPHFLLYWHASHMFSRILNRLAIQRVPAKEAEGRAYAELANILTTEADVVHLVDVRVKDLLLDNYEANLEGDLEDAAPPGMSEEQPTPEVEPPPSDEGAAAPEGEVAKSLARAQDDKFGVLTIFSDLAEQRGDEAQFSAWLHAEPLHEVTPEEQLMIDEAVAEKMESEAPEDGEGVAEGEGGEKPAAEEPTSPAGKEAM
jgi:hypothetical protein